MKPVALTLNRIRRPGLRRRACKSSNELFRETFDRSGNRPGNPVGIRPKNSEVLSVLRGEQGLLPPENIFLFCGSSLDDRTFEDVRAKTGVAFKDIDLFYTYITLHDLFAEKIARDGRPGAYYLVYGFSKVLPRYEAFDLVLPDVGRQGMAALFRKKGS